MVPAFRCDFSRMLNLKIELGVVNHARCQSVYD